MKNKEQIKQIRNYNDKEFAEQIKKLKDELNLMMLEVAAGKVENYAKVSSRKKQYARMLTIRSENGEQSGK